MSGDSLRASRDSRFDVIVVGAGPAGEVIASRLPDHGFRTALVEQELVGGECAYWACIPSKTLLRPPEARSEAERSAGTATPELRFADASAYRDFMIRGLDDQRAVDGYEQQGINVFRGKGSLRGPGQVEVAGRVLEGERLVIATGTDPLIPPIDGLREAGYWTNREATNLKEVPESAIVLGGGPVGVELAQMLVRFGARVTLLEAADRLLAREDERIGELVREALSEDGVDVRLGAQVSAVTTEDGRRTAHFGEDRVSGHELIVAVGRRPRVESLSLENVGIEAGRQGIEVDERCRAGEGVWAVGDVTGAMPFTHVAMYQARVALADIAGEEARADYTAIPRVVFCDPEVAAVGMMEPQAREAGIDIASVRLPLAEAIARPWTYERDPRGEISVVADRGRGVLAGAWAVGPLASEWIHYAALAIKARIPIAVLRDAVAQFPTYTEIYGKALERLDM